MLWVDHARVQAPINWNAIRLGPQDKLIMSKTEAERSVVLKRGNRVWASTKAELEAISHGKCWYCDSRQDRSYLAVDHFRPKGALLEVTPPHEGYWWLAFDISNYRLACNNCNSPSRDAARQVRGKRNYFPIADEATRARKPTDDVDDERPLLLDPFESTDPPLLFFDTDGMARPNPRLCPPGSVRLKRAEVTIDLLNLNQPGIRDRRKMLCRRMRRDYEHAARSFNGFLLEEPTASQRFSAACEALKEAIGEYADLASSARCFLKGWRSEDGIAQEVLDAVV